MAGESLLAGTTRLIETPTPRRRGSSSLPQSARADTGGLSRSTRVRNALGEKNEGKNGE